MRTKKLFLILTLLCTIVQGTWAQNYDVWDGVSEDHPAHYQDTRIVLIECAANLAYIRNHWTERAFQEYEGDPRAGDGYFKDVDFDECEFLLLADLDMSAVNWEPLPALDNKFNGQGHTIRIKIDGATADNQGLFKEIASGGELTSLHVTGNIHCANSRLVGGICGENNGTIRNCWVSADVRSDWSGSGYAKVGGIAGQNDGLIEFCCMTGNVTNYDDNVGGLVGDNSGDIVRHCTFYGTLNIDSSKANENKYAGDSGTEEDCYDTYYEVHYNYAGGSSMGTYQHAYKHPYAVSVNTVRDGVVTADTERTYPDNTVTLNVTSGAVVSVSITDADGNIIPLQGQAHDGSSYWFVMPRRNVTATVVFFANWPTQGAGTESDPYIISSQKDWDDFAYNVSNGRDYSGQYIKLTNDISVSTMAGGSETNGFKGTFDGDSHTLTFNMSGQTEKFVAPFRCVGGSATIKNLKTAGSISSSNMYATGLIASIEKSNENNSSITIENCRSSIAIDNSGSGDMTISGFVGRIEGATLTIRGCAFDGSLAGSSATGSAGFVSWIAPNSNVTIEDCLFAPSTISTSTDLCTTFARKADDASAKVTVTNSYYTQSLGMEQGTLCVPTATAPSNLGTLVHEYGMVTAYTNGILYDDTYYIVPFILSGSGTESDPYTIGSTYEWNSFAISVGKGTTYSGQYVKLTEDITVSTMAGGSETNGFKGTFDGDGHTLTFNMTGQTEKFVAPFRCVGGTATIKNLKTAGSISTSNMYAAGLVASIENVGGHVPADFWPSVSIESCKSSMAITNSGSGEMTISGLVGRIENANLTIRGCVFDGSLSGSSATGNAGFVSWAAPHSNVTIEDCIFTPGSISTSTDQCATHARMDNDPSAVVSVNNCYYSQSYGSNQGIRVYSIIPDTYATIENAGTVSKSYDAIGLTFYTAGIQCGDAHYAVSGNDMSLTLGDNRPGYTAATFQTSGGTFSGTENPYTLIMPAENVTVSVATWTLDEYTPDANGHYIINNEEDWGVFAAQVENGNNFSGQTVKLNADISVSLMVGNTYNSFQGIFDGQGHTLTFNKGTATEPFAEEHCAPFRHVINGTICNLKVKGDIYTSRGYAAGLIAEAGDFYGPNITNCQISTVIHSSVNGNAFHGGIVAQSKYAEVRMTGCVYNGRLFTTNGSTGCGGLVAISFNGMYGRYFITTSVYAPDTSIAAAEGETPIASGNTLVYNPYASFISSSYYTEALGQPDGTPVYSISGGTDVTVENAAEVSNNYDVSGLIFYNNNNDFKFADVYYGASGNNVALRLGSSRTDYIPGGFEASAGTLSGSANPHTLTMPNENVIINATSWSQELQPDSNGDYHINNADDWMAFCAMLNQCYNDFSGKNVLLNADISVSTMAGADENYPFSGNFIGGGHTLTFTKGSSEETFNEEYCAPFYYIKDAAIRNLKVTGDIYTSRKFAGGLVARTFGTTNITGCVVGTNIYSTIKGDGTHGGIVAMPQDGSTLNIEGCAYDGRLLTNNGTNSCGGFVGWHGGATISVSNSLYVPGSSIPTGWTAISHEATFARGGSPTITNCDYTETMGNVQGTQVYAYAVIPTNLGERLQDYGMLEAYANGIIYDGTFYGTPTIVSLADNADNSTTISNTNGCVADVTLDGRTLYRDGAWNTLCLPFSVDDFNGTPLHGATVKTLTSTDFSDGTLTMNFSEENVSAIEAGKPYIVKWVDNVVDLSKLTSDYTAQEGDLLTGTLGGDYKISIANGVIVTLQNVTINGTNSETYQWAGINCIGDATIILKGTNNVKGFYENWPGINVPKGSTLTIKGSGTLNASSNSHGSGIGGGTWISCGNITIIGGTINAMGGRFAAGIGAGGFKGNSCGNITITDGVTKVTASTDGGPYSIGAGSEGTCGTVTIGGKVGATTDNPYTYTGKGYGSVDDVVNPEFRVVVVSDATAKVETDYADFVGTYSPESIYTAAKTNLYLGADNTLYYPTEPDFQVNAFRAYFQLKQGLTAGEPTNLDAGVRAFKLNFGDGTAAEPSAIQAVSTDSKSDGAWYTLDGRKLDAVPTTKGLYINNGKKVIIK